MIFWKWSAHRRCKTQELGIGSTHLGFELRIGNFSRAEHPYLAPVQTKVRRLAVGIEFVAIGDDSLVIFRKESFRIARHLPCGKSVATRPVGSPLHSPFQGTHDAVVVQRREATFPVVHPLCVTSAHESIEI